MGKSSTPTEYQKFVNEKSPSSPLFTDCIKAFLVGGLICSIGQLIFFFCKYKGLDETSCSTIVSISLIGIAAFLTSINVFNKIGKFAGAGTLVPITGFANSIVAPAMEYKSEGYVMGVGAKMFTVAGPVLVFGITSSVIVGIIACLF
jgi:stage V sporulation protein AC